MYDNHTICQQEKFDTYDNSRNKSGQRHPVLAIHIDTPQLLISLLLYERQVK
jgi:hypothetical protein